MGRKGQKGSGRRNGPPAVLEGLRSGREITKILIDAGALKGRAEGKIGEIVEPSKESESKNR